MKKLLKPAKPLYEYVYNAIYYIKFMVLGLLIGLLLANVAKAATPYTFHYRDKSELKITVEAETNCAAYRKAAKMCYNILTKGKYPGEDAAMDVIDICVNPSNFGC